uniref:Uncharacterized protein n=1 Tax=Arundo donax TaxID=35708 RepID=A0A0A9AE57_ARUDO
MMSFLHLTKMKDRHVILVRVPFFQLKMNM